MLPDPMSPYGLALMDYYKGNQVARVILHRDDDTYYELPMSIFFRNSSDFSTIEKKAIGLCFGKILDAGAGAGQHSLFMQQNGFDVFSIDISPEAVEIMKKQGLTRVKCVSIFFFF